MRGDGVTPAQNLEADFQKQYDCCQSSLWYANKALVTGEYDMAESRIEDFMRSLNELRHLVKMKKAMEIIATEEAKRKYVFPQCY
jgi:hypothetical protein